MVGRTLFRIVAIGVNTTVVEERGWDQPWTGKESWGFIANKQSGEGEGLGWWMGNYWEDTPRMDSHYVAFTGFLLQAGQSDQISRVWDSLSKRPSRIFATSELGRLEDKMEGDW